MPISASVPGLGRIAELLGADTTATVLAIGGRSFLHGNFKFALLGQQSASIRLDGHAGDIEVQQDGGGGLQIVRLRTIYFFAYAGTPFAIGSGRNPRLVAAEISLSSVQSTIWVTLQRVAISCLSGVDPSQHPGCFVHPSSKAGGMIATPLREWSAPDEPTGFPVYGDAEGFWVRAGPRQAQTVFDHAPGVSLSANNYAWVSFKIANLDGTAAASIRFRDELNKGSILVAAGKNSQLELRGRTFDATDKALSIREAVIADGFLSVANFQADEVSAYCTAGGRRCGNLQGAATQFTLHLSIPESGAAPLATPGAQIVFRDARVVGDHPYSSHRQRFYGLAIPGLATSRADDEVFDCSLATASLENGTFRLAAGGALSMLKEQRTEVSRLIPKVQASKRMLDAPAGSMRLSADRDQPDLLFRSADAGARLVVLRAQLRGRPIGTSAAAHAPTGGMVSGLQSYADWTLERPTEFGIAINAGGFSPEDGPSWPETFSSRTQHFSLMEHPGASVTLSRLPNASLLQAGDVKETSFGIAPVDDKEMLVYTALCAALSYAALACRGVPYERCFKTDDIKLRFKTFDGKKFAAFVEGAASNDLRLVLGGPDGKEALHSFIDDNVGPVSDASGTVICHWPLAQGLSVLLRQDQNGTATYCDDVAFQPAARIGIDLSEIKTLPADKIFGTGQTWASVARSAPELWPYGANTSSMRPDPSYPRWSGVMFRKMPLYLVAPEGAIEQIEKHLPALAGLYRELNKSMLLEYGWHDEHGPTWLAGLNANPPIKFSPPFLDPLVKLYLISAESRGAKGVLVKGAGKVLVELPLIENDAGKPLELEGQFDLDLTARNVSSTVYIRAAHGSPFASTSSVPGFSEVRLSAIGTDWSRLKVDLELVTAPTLAAALPALASTSANPLKAVLSLGLKGAQSPVVTLAFAKVIKTHLFGSFPIAVEAMTLDLSSNPKLIIPCTVDLGLPGFQQCGLNVVLSKDASPAGFSLSIQLKKIDGMLQFGDVKVRGELEWEEEEFRGSLALEGGSFKEVSGLYARIGTRGDRPYWIAALLSGRTVPITAGAKVEGPVVLLSHAMDYDGGKLYSALTDVERPLKGLRPPQLPTDKRWLDDWDFSPKVGSALAMSGYLVLQEFLAGSTQDRDDAQGKYLTNLVLTDDGRVRADAWLNLFGQLPTRFVIAIDTRRKIMAAGMQLPEIKLPKESPNYEISPGFVALKIGYGAETVVRFSLGWPDRVDGPGQERDWEKCTRVKIDQMVPLNTFWGGILVEYSNSLSGGKGGFRFGIAIRAGWTKTYKAGGKGIAYAEASLGITFGGVFVWAVYEADEYPAFTVLQLKSESPTTKQFNELISEVAAYVDSVRRDSLVRSDLDSCFSAEIYGDINGRAYAEFMGVTLASIKVDVYARFKMCGTIRAGITECRASAGFDIEVRIACISYSAHAEIDITLIDGSCPAECNALLPRNQESALLPFSVTDLA